MKAQTRHILETIKAVLEAAGGSLKDVTFNQIFLSDMGGYAAMNEVYRSARREKRSYWLYGILLLKMRNRSDIN